MWSTLLLPLLLLHLVQLHSTLAMATASGGLTVLEGSSTSSSSGSGSSSGTGSGSVSSSSSITGNMLVSASPASSSASASSTSSTASSPVATGLRKRHRKRNSSWYDYRNYSENNTALEWINPCGGSYYTPSAPERRRVQRPKQVSNDHYTPGSILSCSHSALSPAPSSTDLQPVEARRWHRVPHAEQQPGAQGHRYTGYAEVVPLQSQLQVSAQAEAQFDGK